MNLSDATGRRRATGGFTFIEMLIAVAVFSVVALALYSAFFAGVKVWKRSNQGQDEYQRVGFVLEDIDKELKNSVYMNGPSGDEDDEGSVYDFKSGEDFIEFFTLSQALDEEGNPFRQLVKMRYSYDESQKVLLRAAADVKNGFSTEKTSGESIIEGVEVFELRYAYLKEEEEEPYDWKKEWVHENRMIPRGVRIYLELASAAEKGKKEIHKTIFVPLGVLGEEEDL